MQHLRSRKHTDAHLDASAPHNSSINMYARAQLWGAPQHVNEGAGRRNAATCESCFWDSGTCPLTGSLFIALGCVVFFFIFSCLNSTLIDVFNTRRRDKSPRVAESERQIKPDTHKHAKTVSNKHGGGVRSSQKFPRLESDFTPCVSLTKADG